LPTLDDRTRLVNGDAISANRWAAQFLLTAVPRRLTSYSPSRVTSIDVVSSFSTSFSVLVTWRVLTNPNDPYVSGTVISGHHKLPIRTTVNVTCTDWTVSEPLYILKYISLCMFKSYVTARHRPAKLGWVFWPAGACRNNNISASFYFLI
jgi:hypothetical protein